MVESLRNHVARISAVRIPALFAAEPDRLTRMSLPVPGFFADFSKHHIDQEGLSALMKLAGQRDVEGQRAALFSGAHVNFTEDRPALHMALRGPERCPAALGDEISAGRAAARAFAEGIRLGTIPASDGGRFTQILHLGIGGSDLGPRLLADMFGERGHGALGLRFCANADAGDFARAIDGLDPRRTLVFFVSKSFNTSETLLNAQSARAWLGTALPDAAIGDHFALASANIPAASAWGVRADRIFPFRAWVGGRYSVWSAGSLSIETAFGSTMFEEFLAGGAAMDAHFLDAPMPENAPVLAGLVEYWNAFGLNCATRCVAAYANGLARLPSFLQQLEMESLGKQVDRSGAAALAAPVVWGGEGTLVQHSFFQRLHQANDPVPLDIVAVARNPHGRPEHDYLSLAHALAQAEAFMLGRTEDQAASELRTAGFAPGEVMRLAPHLVCPGNRGSSFYLLDEMSPFALGAFVAFQEHKTFVLSVLMQVNAFDQYGVELGKNLALRTAASLRGAGDGAHDPSTTHLIARIRQARGE